MRTEGGGERHAGPVRWKGEGRGKPDVIASLGRCAENRLLTGLEHQVELKFCFVFSEVR